MVVIVAIGDSLTVGYQSSDDEGWAEFVPYTVFLEERLRDLGQPKELKSQIYNRGIIGELTNEMLARFDRDVLNVKPNYVIVLGGTNDLGIGLSPKEVFSNLVAMYEKASENYIEPVGCSVPSILGCDSLIPPRVALNEMIRAHCVARRIVFADVFRATADPQTSRLLDEYTNDGLHLNTPGYRKIADTIFKEALEGLLMIHLSRHE